MGIYGLTGRLVRVVARGRYASGAQSATWDGRDASGRQVRNGIYFLRSQSGGRATNLKLVVLQ